MHARAALLFVVLVGPAAAACGKSEPAPTPPPASAPAPAPPPPAPSPPPAPPTPDPGADPASDPRQRAVLLERDRPHLAKHVALLAFAQQTRARYDALLGPAGQPVKASPTGVKKMEKLQTSLRPQVDEMDPTGQNLYLSPDHDTYLHYLADEYPAAAIGALSGDPAPLAEIRVEMDKLEKKVSAWIAELRKPAP